MEIAIGDIIETKVGGPYKVINVIDNLVIFEMKGGIGQTITEYVTKIISKAMNTCEYSGLASVKSYETEDKTFKQKSKWTKVNNKQQGKWTKVNKQQ
jgi:hypothetical protein